MLVHIHLMDIHQQYHTQELVIQEHLMLHMFNHLIMLAMHQYKPTTTAQEH